MEILEKNQALHETARNLKIQIYPLSHVFPPQFYDFFPFEN